MNSSSENQGKSEAHNRFHAKKRRARRDRSLNRKSKSEHTSNDLYLYGLHTVRHALENPARKKICLHATRNGLQRLDIGPESFPGLEIREVLPKALDQMVGPDAVHQGVVLETRPLVPSPLEDLGNQNLVLVLDQVTDPHNVGAIMRSAVALGAGALITTSRHSPAESGVLAKSASGAVDLITLLEVRNLAEALGTLHDQGYVTIGLDSEAGIDFSDLQSSEKIAIVLGAEGKGLRQKTRETCRHLARLDMPGPIKSLNVSNAAAITLYECRRLLTG